MTTLLADLLFVAAVVAISAAATGPAAVWWPGKYPQRCDTCGRRHDGECSAATPAHRVPSWAQKEHTP